MGKYENLFNNKTFAANRSFSNNFCLLYVEAQIGSVLTSGPIHGYVNYSSLLSYKEELQVINKQFSGEKGIHSANLVICIPKSPVSIALYNKFFAKSILKTVQVVDIVEANNAFTEKYKITYTNCKIESYNHSVDSVEMSINYTNRQDKAISYNQDGTKAGNTIGNI